MTPGPRRYVTAVGQPQKPIEAWRRSTWFLAHVAVEWRKSVSRLVRIGNRSDDPAVILKTLRDVAEQFATWERIASELAAEIEAGNAEIKRLAHVVHVAEDILGPSDHSGEIPSYDKAGNRVS